MERVILFIDGFNVYHAIVRNPSLRQYRWLDYQRLGQRLLSAQQCLEDVFYFTAFLPDQESARRHRLFNQAQKEQGVKIILGQYKRRDRYCTKCGKDTASHEEKQTDVGIAIELFRQAMHDRYDRALILSADSDLIPAIDAVKKEFINKKICVVLPADNTGTQELKNIAHSWKTLNESLLHDSQLPDCVQVGKKILRKPEEW